MVEVTWCQLGLLSGLSPPTPSQKVPLYLAAPPPRVLGLGRQPPPGSPFLSVSPLKLSFATSSQNHVLRVPCSATPIPASHPETLSPGDVSAFVSRPTGTSAQPGTELPALATWPHVMLTACGWGRYHHYPCSLGDIIQTQVGLVTSTTIISVW